jgi:hypothetical protein
VSYSYIARICTVRGGTSVGTRAVESVHKSSDSDPDSASSIFKTPTPTPL